MSRAALRYAATLLLALLAAHLLAGCGGGDPEPEKQVDPPDCKARPELCA